MKYWIETEYFCLLCEKQFDVDELLTEFKVWIIPKCPLCLNDLEAGE